MSNHSEERQQTKGEELFNAISHGLAVVGAVVGAPLLIIGAVRTGGTAGIVGASVFAATVVILYSISAEVPDEPALLQPAKAGVINRSPLWAPDGKTIIFSSER